MAAKATERVAQTVSLEQLIQVSSSSAIRAFREAEIDRRFNPRIWVGIWIEPFGPGDFNIPGTGPGR
jgi:hypothetical protein